MKLHKTIRQAIYLNNIKKHNTIIMESLNKDDQIKMFIEFDDVNNKISHIVCDLHEELTNYNNAHQPNETNNYKN